MSTRIIFHESVVQYIRKKVKLFARRKMLSEKKKNNFRTVFGALLSIQNFFAVSGTVESTVIQF